MSQTDLEIPEGAKKLSPRDMNKLASLKAHTVITCTDTPATPQSSQ